MRQYNIGNLVAILAADSVMTKILMGTHVLAKEQHNNNDDCSNVKAKWLSDISNRKLQQCY